MNSRISQLLEKHQLLPLPGVYDCLSARIAETAGFPLALVSGYAVSATLLGEPDIGLLTQTEILAAARRICRKSTMPILVDADTGYGNPLNVQRTVTELIEAGAAGCFLEDQQWPKRCGHMPGKRVVDRNEYLERIHAAVEAAAGHDFFLVARTDALAELGLDEALERVTAARKFGADASFIEGPIVARAVASDRSPSPSANGGQYG